MILKMPGETVLDAIARTGRTFSVNPMILANDETSGNVAMLYELIGELAADVIALRARVEVLEKAEDGR